MNEEDKDESTVQPPLKGRAAAIGRYKTANPDMQDEPDEDTLHDFSDNRYSDLEGKYNELNGANTKLAELVGKDPKLGAFISMIAGEKPKSVPYALSSVFGKDSFALEGDSLDEFEKGYQEELQRLAESKSEREEATKNIEEYDKRLTEYGKTNGLTEEQLDEVHAGLVEFVFNVIRGIIPNELIDLVYKGMNYDRDVQEAADTGFVEGKNETVSAKMKSKTNNGPLPDMNSGTGAGRKREHRAFETTPSSVYDNLKEVD